MKNKFRKHTGSFICLNKNSIHPNLGRTLFATAIRGATRLRLKKTSLTFSSTTNAGGCSNSITGAARRSYFLHSHCGSKVHSVLSFRAGFQHVRLLSVPSFNISRPCHSLYVLMIIRQWMQLSIVMGRNHDDKYITAAHYLCFDSLLSDCHLVYFNVRTYLSARTILICYCKNLQ